MSMRNMATMFGAMALLRRIDQEEPLVLLYARMAYLGYVGITALMYIFLHFRIIAKRDTTLIDVPIAAKAPSFSEGMERARKAAEEKARTDGENSDDQSQTSTEVTNATTPVDEEEEEEEEEGEEEEREGEQMETITIMEYDLRHLATTRRSWVTSSCFLAAVHYHMQSVSPLFMSGIMGVIRLFTEDPLIQIHLRGSPAVDKLARPFTPEKNPLAAMLKDFGPKADSSTTAVAAANQAGTASTTAPTADDDLHDDGDDDDDDTMPNTVMSGTQDDDHIKSDFDDEMVTAMEGSSEAKKDV